MKRIFLTFLITGLLICMFLLLSTCKQSTEQEEKDETGLVVPGVGMDGIKLGDTLETVLTKLGNPSNVGFLDGFYRSWFAYDYDNGPHAGLEIAFIHKPDGSYGIVDLISARAALYSGIPYSGKTKEGIGLGSKLREVHNVFGLPDTTLYFTDSTRTYEFFCFGQKHFQIAYDDSIISAFSTGYYQPMPQDPKSNCK